LPDRIGDRVAPTTDVREAAGADGGLLGGIDGRDRRPGPDAERHDPDQCRRPTAAQGIRAVSCSTRFLGWTLRGSVAALVCAAGHRDPNPPPLAVR